jgi:DNA-binding response OmpR family regulator
MILSMEKRKIIAVNSNKRNLELLEQFLNKAGFDTIPVSTLGEFDLTLLRKTPADIALIDVSGFDSSIWSRCERLHQCGLPFLILSTRQTEILQKESVSKGARAVLVKPLIFTELVGIIHTLIDEKDAA